MKRAETIFLFFVAAFCVAGIAVAFAATRDPAWRRGGDVAEPLIAMVFMAGVAMVLASLIAFAAVWMRKR